jgi:hypothetical protein
MNEKQEILKALENKSIEELEALYKITLLVNKDQLLKVPKVFNQFKTIIFKYL